MYTECYLFRRLRTCFSRRELNIWKEYDIWAEQKHESLTSSGSVVLELVEWFFGVDSPLSESKTCTEDSVRGWRTVLEDLLQISLWGNTADLLSLLATSPEELRSRQGAQARERLKSNVVVDDTGQVIDLLDRIRTRTRVQSEIHVVLDNAGFELISDLVLVTYLLRANFTEKVVLHGKAFPWYISDATRGDFELAFSVLSNFEGRLEGQDDLSGSRPLSVFASIIKSHLNSDPPRLVFTTDPFWTTAHPFARLPACAPELCASLQKADLVIFKGDLNYRKLIAGGRWPPDTSFEAAIGPLAHMNLRILALRTCKGDACVGLQKDHADQIDPKGNGEWTRNGQYGVISFSDGKTRE